MFPKFEFVVLYQVTNLETGESAFSTQEKALQLAEEGSHSVDSRPHKAVHITYQGMEAFIPMMSVL